MNIPPIVALYIHHMKLQANGTLIVPSDMYIRRDTLMIALDSENRVGVLN